MAAPNWEEWGKAAFDRAAAEDKPILLALTSPYPWSCQLMDRDAWSDPEIAKLANDHYVPIRVIVDLRPDIYDRYTAGTVPSTVFLTPKGQLLWGGGFMPPHELTVALSRLHAGYAANKERLLDSIRDRDALINKVKDGQYEGRVEINDEILPKTIQGIIDTFDAHNGGFGHSPKTPLTSSLEVLLLAVKRNLHPDAKQVLTKTLDAIIKGLWDPVDGGFFAMARTEYWTQPETEKLWANQAALIDVFMEASALQLDRRYKDISASAVEWVGRVLQARWIGQVADPEYYGLDVAERRKRKTPEVPPLAMADPGSCLPHLLRDTAHAIKATSRLATKGEAHAYLDVVLRPYREPESAGLLDRPVGQDELGELKFRKRPLDENAKIAHALAKLGRKDEARAILESFPDFGIDYGHMTAEFALAVDALLG